MDQRDYRRARAAFDEVIRVRPEMRQAYYNRALANFHLGDLPGARADLTHVLSDSKPPLRAYFFYARVRAKQGDREGARRDQEDGLRAEPRDEQDLTARGPAITPPTRGRPWPTTSRSEAQPALPGGLSEQSKCSCRKPRPHRRGHQGARPGSRALPELCAGRAGRGVLHARLGRREAAHADARETLRTNSEPFTIYQVAGIYALTSRQEPADRREAFRLLESIGYERLSHLVVHRPQARCAFRRVSFSGRARRTVRTAPSASPIRRRGSPSTATWATGRRACKPTPSNASNTATSSPARTT